ncbi:MAG: TerB family tellurite resistance protein [Lachnospiraceae bacterium]|nr:TerB family tellurite resistance protein [Lachnospiraceae bacterium]
MFLDKLNNEEQEAFLSLSVHAAKANGVVEEEEKSMIKEYCREMGHSHFNTEDVLPFEKVVEIYGNSEMQNRKIVLMEILGLLYADGTYDEKEKAFIQDFAEKICLDPETVEKQTGLIKKYLELVKEMAESVV